jgi:hypothetical protein
MKVRPKVPSSQVPSLAQLQVDVDEGDTEKTVDDDFVRNETD